MDDSEEKLVRPFTLFAESVPQLSATQLFKARPARVAFGIDQKGLRMTAALQYEESLLRISLNQYSPQLSGFYDVYEVPLAVAKAGSAGTRVVFICDDCGSARDIIYLHPNHWACRKCHGLNYRSQYMPQEQKDRSERDQLRRDVQEGRRRYQRQSSWEVKVARLKELESRPESSRALRNDQSELTWVTLYEWRDEYLEDDPLL